MKKAVGQSVDSAVQKLIDDVRHGDERTRRYAAEDIGYEGHREGIPFLVKGLEDESIAVSEACANALVKIGGEEIAEKIAPALASENVRLRNHVSEIMNLLGESAVGVLIRQMESPDRDVRMFAVDNLVNIASRKSHPTLIKALDDENVNVAAAAAIGIGKMGDPSHLDILKGYLDSEDWLKCSVIQAMGYLGNPEAIDIILPYTRDSDLMVKMSAIQSLAKLADHKILPDLIDLLKEESIEIFGLETLNVIYEIICSDPDNDYSDLFDDKLMEVMLQLAEKSGVENKIKAIEILGYSNEEYMIPKLIELITSDGIDIRKSVVKSVTRINPQDLGLMKELLNNPDTSFEHKCTALECIGRSSSEERYSIIREFLKSGDETLRRITLDSIHEDFEPVPVKEIIHLLRSDVLEIRISAAAAMGRIKIKDFISPLLEQLKDDSPELQEAVDDALICIGGKHEIPLLAPYLESFSKSERKMAFEYFGIHAPESISRKFIEGLEDPSVDIRIISLKVLANLKRTTLDLVAGVMKDPVEMVRVEAVRALKSLPPSREIVDYVLEALHTIQSERIKVELIQVLSGLEDFNVVDSVIPLLDDSSSWVQIETIELLKKRGDKSVVKNLEKLLHSENEELVSIVEEAIEVLD